MVLSYICIPRVITDDIYMKIYIGIGIPAVIIYVIVMHICIPIVILDVVYPVAPVER